MEVSLHSARGSPFMLLGQPVVAFHWKCGEGSWPLAHASCHESEKLWHRRRRAFVLMPALHHTREGGLRFIRKCLWSTASVYKAVRSVFFLCSSLTNEDRLPCWNGRNVTIWPCWGKLTVKRGWVIGWTERTSFRSVIITLSSDITVKYSVLQYCTGLLSAHDAMTSVRTQCEHVKFT